MEWDLQTLLYALGAMGLFTSRAFVPAFFTALMMRYGNHLPFLGEIEFLQTTGQEPTWFTSNFTILALGVLAIGEVLATKVPEIEEWMATFYKTAKSAMAALTTLGVLNSQDAAFITETMAPVSQAGVMDTVVGVFVAAVVWILSTLRNLLMETIYFADPDGSIGLRRLVSWAEDLWATFGIIFLFIYPIGMTILIIGVAGSMGLLRRWKQFRENRSKIDCPHCQASIYPSALCCPQCGGQNPEPAAIGFFGQSIRKPAADRALAAQRLAEKKRCPRCAGRLRKRDPMQRCPDCGHVTFGDADFAGHYQDGVAARLPKVLGVSALFSLIPVIGLIPGVIYYRIALVAPFMGYIPAGRSLLLKIVLRIILLLLITLQLVPGIGAVSVPLMALLSFGIYRGSFRSYVNVLKDAIDHNS